MKYRVLCWGKKKAINSGCTYCHVLGTVGQFFTNAFFKQPISLLVLANFDTLESAWLTTAMGAKCTLGPLTAFTSDILIRTSPALRRDFNGEFGFVEAESIQQELTSGHQTPWLLLREFFRGELSISLWCRSLWRKKASTSDFAPGGSMGSPLTWWGCGVQRKRRQ